jgi:hypothetical protein
VSFLNDAWGGTAATDRNLYVTGVSCDGVAAGGSLAFLTNGAQSLVVGTAPAPVTVGSGPDTLDLKVNEDAWNGDAQFTVSVDGRQIGGTLTAQAYRCAGGVQDVLVLGSFGAGPHTAAVSFINDAWGGTAAADRNLYVTGATMDGAAIGGSALTLIANGAGSFAFQGVAPVSGTLPAPTLALAAASDSGVAGDNITRTAKPTFAGVAQAGATVGIQIDGSFVGTGQADATGAWSYTAAVALADGAHTVTATAVEAGNTSAAAKLALTIDTSTMAPTVALAAASDSGVPATASPRSRSRPSTVRRKPVPPSASGSTVPWLVPSRPMPPAPGTARRLLRWPSASTPSRPWPLTQRATPPTPRA